MDAISGATILNGLILGWSVAWPPGPINAEMIRRALLPRAEGGGFWAAWQLGLGACTGDFLWALGVAVGAGALLASQGLHKVLGIVTFCLLLFLAFNFARGAWRTWQTKVGGASGSRSASSDDRGPTAAPTLSRGYLLGLILALTSPWNIGFWFAVVGGQGAAQRHATFLSSLTLAAAVVSGAIAWTIVLCTALKLGARIFARPAWQIGTQAVSALVMLFFAARLVWLWR
ncbi:MAG TPA: LysE family transporter [Chthoniobacterales bacterium]|jgi:threonine/homoserine/homoserine lactone efflux protein|nr:LysE family transporter [Chthoniobacterales bacterium]